MPLRSPPGGEAARVKRAADLRRPGDPSSAILVRPGRGRLFRQAYAVRRNSCGIALPPRGRGPTTGSEPCTPWRMASSCCRGPGRLRPVSGGGTGGGPSSSGGTAARPDRPRHSWPSSRGGIDGVLPVAPVLDDPEELARHRVEGVVRHLAAVRMYWQKSDLRFHPGWQRGRRESFSCHVCGCGLPECNHRKLSSCFMITS